MPNFEEPIQNSISGVSMAAIEFSRLSEPDVCEIAAAVLQDELGADAPNADDLRVPYRIIAHQYRRASFEFEESETGGRGFGPAEAQWLTTIALNLASMLIWVTLEKGFKALSDSDMYQTTRAEILKEAGRARVTVERLLERMRQRLLDRKPPDSAD